MLYRFGLLWLFPLVPGLKRVTVMRDPVTEFLHAWVNLGVGNKL